MLYTYIYIYLHILGGIIQNTLGIQMIIQWEHSWNRALPNRAFQEIVIGIQYHRQSIYPRIEWREHLEEGPVFQFKMSVQPTQRSQSFWIIPRWAWKSNVNVVEQAMSCADWIRIALNSVLGRGDFIRKCEIAPRMPKVTVHSVSQDCKTNKSKLFRS